MNLKGPLVSFFLLNQWLASRCYAALTNFALASNGAVATADPLHSSSDYAPSKAIDGDTRNTCFNSNSDSSPDPWLKVEFARDAIVGYFRVYIKSGNSAFRPTTLTLYDGDGGVVLTKDITNSFTSSAGTLANIVLPTPYPTVRSLKVSGTVVVPTEYISVAEVSAFGTVAPTLPPTMSPSDVPSETPSTSPSGVPSATPSAEPTGGPTPAPSPSPSASPSVSVHPSVAPTGGSAAPTQSPAPSTAPTSTPSVQPSDVPSGVPSVTPERDCSNFANATFRVGGVWASCAEFEAQDQDLIDELCSDWWSPASKLCFSTCSTCLTRRASVQDGAQEQVYACEDLVDAKFPMIDSAGETKDCTWLRGQDEDVQQDYCIPTNPAYHICEQVCGKCADFCQDAGRDQTLPSYYTSPQRLGRATTCFELANLPRDWSRACQVEGIRVLCQDTCNSCEIPSTTPSDAPSVSDAPSASPVPTEEQALDESVETQISDDSGVTCDDKEFVYFMVLGAKEKNCAWLRGHMERKVADTNEFKGEVPSVVLESYGISSLSDFGDTVWRDILCLEDDPAYRACEESCGFCSDDCEEDPTATFVDEAGVARTCLWLRDRPRNHNKYCEEGSKPAAAMCLKTCETCV